MSLRTAGLTLCSAAMLAGCATIPAQQTALITAAVTMASVAAANNSTVASLVTKGALFCQKVQAGAPLIVALADLAGGPVSVIDQTSTAVASACAAIQAVPVSPPADPTTVPVVPSATTLPPVA